MMIHEITPKAGKYKNRKRLGKGIASGHGKTCGRGTKGAGARSGWGGSIRASREGGSVPFFRRLPKRGFNNYNFRTEYVVVNLTDLESSFEDGANITPESLVEAGLIHDTHLPVKVLGGGEVKKKLNVSVASFSKTAADKITKAGGKANGQITVKPAPIITPAAPKTEKKAEVPAEAKPMAEKSEKREKKPKPEGEAGGDKPKAPKGDKPKKEPKAE